MEKAIATAVLIVGDAALLGVVAYLVVLVVAGALVKPKRPVAAERNRRFAVIVPAHNEEAFIVCTLRSLNALDYPRPLFDVHVIADNCNDRTAAVARDFTPFVHERTDKTGEGKGQALRWLFDRLPAGLYDAFAIIDADSVVSRNFLAAMNDRLEGGWLAVQSYYGVLEPERSWAASLRAVAFCLLQYARRSGLSALGASAGLGGNGMVFAADLRQAREWDAFGVAEDLEFHAKLMTAGVKVGFAPEASVLGDMPLTLAASRGQNLRWERGRLALARQFVPKLAAAAIRDRDWSKLATAIDLAVPPLSVIALAAVLLLVAAVALASTPATVLASVAVLGLTAYVLVGLASARAPLRLWLSLGFAPLYAVWKARLYAQTLLARGTPAWTRAGRAGEATRD
jgi:1,2-diacylglycerol 3-beta-glucosyltransferase